MTVLHLALTFLIIGILAAVHEAGHFAAARLFGVTVNEFSIGMGPKLLQKKGKKYDTVYTLRALPIGGYVSMPGEDGESDDANAFCNRKAWQRFLILVAGALMNLLIGFAAMLVLVGFSQSLASTTVAQFAEDAVSSAYGLQIGDEVIKVNSTRVHTGDELVYEITYQGAEPLDLTVYREVDGKKQKVVLQDVSFQTTEENGVVFAEYDFLVYASPKTVGTVLKHAFFRSVSAIKMVLDSVKGILTGRFGLNSLSGPVGISETVGTAASVGFGSLLYIFALLAMNLGVINLLPLPALDGGRILFVLIEMVRGGKKINPKFEGMVHLAGMILLFALMIMVTFKDIGNLFS